MASITFAVDEKLKSRIAEFAWVNWSELAREELMKQEKTREAFEKFKAIATKSKLTEKNAKELADKISLSMHKKLKDKGLV